jgi:hypothetical protein
MSLKRAMVRLRYVLRVGSGRLLLRLLELVTVGAAPSFRRHNVSQQLYRKLPAELRMWNLTESLMMQLYHLQRWSMLHPEIQGMERAKKVGEYIATRSMLVDLGVDVGSPQTNDS